MCQNICRVPNLKYTETKQATGPTSAALAHTPLFAMCVENQHTTKIKIFAVCQQAAHGKVAPTWPSFCHPALSLSPHIAVWGLASSVALFWRVSAFGTRRSVCCVHNARHTANKPFAVSWIHHRWFTVCYTRQILRRVPSAYDKLSGSHSGNFDVYAGRNGTAFTGSS